MVTVDRMGVKTKLKFSG